MGAAGNIAPPAGAAPGGTSLDPAKKARLQKAVKDFEAIFLGMMMKSMRSSVPKDEGAGDSFGGDIMESMFDEEVARQMAGKSNLGLADMLYRSITHEPMPAQQNAGPAPLQAGPALAPQAVPALAPAAPQAPQAWPAPRDPGKLSPAPVNVGALPESRGGTLPAGAATRATSGADPASNTAPVPPPAQAKIAAPGGPPVIAPPHTVRKRIAAYEDLIQEAASYHGVDSTVIKAVMAAESGGDRTAVSPRDAKGLMQLTDSTAVDMGVRNVWNARDNIQGGTRYLQSLLQRFDGDTKNAIASYNAGPARVEKHGGVPPIPETQAYVRRVMNYIQYFQQEESAHEGR